MRWQFASTFAVMAMSGCFKESTVPCPDGVLCPADQACTGNTSGLRCGAEVEVMQCRDKDGALCTRAVDLDENGMGDDGFCEAALCSPCAPDLYQCRYEFWTPMGSSASNLESIWIASERDAYAVGAEGMVLHYNGQRWSALPMIANGPALVGVWGQTQDVFAISNGGTVFRNNVMQANAPNNLTAIWGSGATNLVAVGAEGLIGEFDGSSWNWTATGGLSSFNDVDGVADGVIAVGLGRVRHRTGQGSWSAISPPNNTDVLEGVWGLSSTDFYVVGHPELPPDDVYGVIHHYKDGVWGTPEAIPTQPRVPRLYAIWGSSSTDIHAVGEDGTFIHYDGAWSYSNGDPSTTAPTINDIDGVNRDAIVVGIDGSIVRLGPR